jgi:FdhE protein
MTTAATALNGLKRQRPEWQPWLGVIEAALSETEAPAWRAAVPDLDAAAPNTVPLLTGATLSMNARVLRRLLEQLLRAAARSGSAKLGTLDAATSADVNVLTLFKESLCHDTAQVQHVASATGADAQALQAVAALLPVPFLHACTRAWSPVLSESWVEGYCAVCGSWPAFAEVRGIERSRYFRCGRCSSQWHARALCCPYCSMSDHDELVSLVPEKSGLQGTIEACKRCHGYVKTFTRLQGCPAGAVMLEDLASVDLDIAAIEHEYSRPTGAGYPLEVSVIATDAPRGIFAWNHGRH